MALAPGIHALDSEAYHADPCERPSLSASIAHLLCSQSPAHARAAHPRLNPDLVREEKEQYDIGMAGHEALLEGRSTVEIIDANDWRTKAAQEARDEARANGKIPLLARKAAELDAMLAAAHEQLETHAATPRPFTDGQPEQTLVWEEEGGVWCRARIDWLRDDFAAADDLKTTSRSASPAAWSRRIFDEGRDIQAALYVRGVEALTGVTPDFRWVVVETTTPFALSVVAPDPGVLALGRSKVEWALKRWRECLEADHWPGYPTEVCYAELPPWEEARWLERQEREAVAA